MNTTFGHIVDEVRQLTFGEKEELKHLLEQSLIEERREEIFRNFQESQTELKRGELKFSAKITALKKSLGEE